MNATARQIILAIVTITTAGVSGALHAHAPGSVGLTDPATIEVRTGDRIILAIDHRAGNKAKEFRKGNRGKGDAARDDKRERAEGGKKGNDSGGERTPGKAAGKGK